MSESEEERRPRPIGVADESDDDDDSDMDRNSTGKGAAAGIAAGGPREDRADLSAAAKTAPEEIGKKTSSNRRPAFSENDLVKEKGLLQIYNKFPRKCQYKGKGREAEFLRGLMIAYKEWGYQLYPGVAFEDLSSRTEKLGGRARVRDLMRELRDQERDRVIEAKYGQSAVDDVHAQEAAKASAKETAAAENKEDDEDPVSSRYMEVDEKGASSSTINWGEGNERDHITAKAMASTVVSDQVRERMEVNRRLALDRLRAKREEASATAAGVVKANRAALDDSELMDLMDVDAGGFEANDDFEDDEAALAEIEAEATAMEKKRTYFVLTSESGADALPSAGALSTTVNSSHAVESATITCAITDRVESARNDHKKEENVVELRKSGVAGFTASDGITPASVCCDGKAGRASDVGAVGADGSNKTSTDPSATMPDVEIRSSETTTDSGEFFNESSKNSTVKNAASVKVTGETAARGSAPLVSSGDGSTSSVDSAAGGSGEKTSPTKEDGDLGQIPLDSPKKWATAEKYAPMLPLESMFVSTDIPAEGGPAAVRAPLGGMFSDDNF